MLRDSQARLIASRNHSATSYAFCYPVLEHIDKSLDTLQFTDFALVHSNDACDTEVRRSDSITTAFFRHQNVLRHVRDQNYQRTKHRHTFS